MLYRLMGTHNFFHNHILFENGEEITPQYVKLAEWILQIIFKGDLRAHFLVRMELEPYDAQ